MYENMSQVYDCLMEQDVDYLEWTRYIQKILLKYNRKTKSILDIGCGTGNITIPLSEAGFNMSGIDLSEEMLSLADKKSFQKKLKIRWLKGDITKYNINQNYDAIISCCDTLNYIVNIEDLYKVFKNIFNAINTNGVFLFDLNSFHRISNIYGNNVFTYTSNNINYIWENNYCEETKINEYFLIFFIKNEENNYYTRLEEVHYQRAYAQENIFELLYQVGFKKVDVYSFNTLNQPIKSDERIQYCALK